MWLRSQDKTKLLNLDRAQQIALSKSYGSKDSNGNKLNSAIVLQHENTAVVSIGLYKDIEEAMSVMEQITKFMENGQEAVFQMP